MLFIAYQALDIITTLVGLSYGGTEMNPVAGMIGIPGLLSLKVVTTPLLIAVCWLQERRYPDWGRYGLIMLALIFAFATINNAVRILIWRVT
jgi:hypothetical protein